MRFSRITILIVVLAISIGFLLLTRYLLEDLEAQTMQATEEAMIDFVQVIAADLAQGGSTQTWDDAFHKAADDETIDALVFFQRKVGMGLSFYVTDAQGIIQHDSAGVHRPGTNLSKMRDVALTLSGKYGARSSRGLANDPTSSVLHTAAPIYADGIAAEPTGVVTLRKAQKDVLPFVIERRNIISTSAFLIAVGIIIFVLAVFYWLWRPIGRLTSHAEAITAGHRPPKPHLGIGREVNTLATALYTMRDKLEGRNYVEDYVQTLTHELKSPLAGIRGAAELLQEDLSPDQRARFLANIERESQRMTDLISGLLQLSSVEGLRALDHRDPVDLAQLAADVVRSFDDRCRCKNVTITTDIVPEAIIAGDKGLLRLAISNVLENAISFAPASSTVQLALSSEKETHRLTITDRGPGVPDYAGEKIFERFYSLQRPDSSDAPSTGLGLAFVRECMELHGGQVSYQSEPGSTTFQLTLPKATI